MKKDKWFLWFIFSVLFFIVTLAISMESDTSSSITVLVISTLNIIVCTIVGLSKETMT